MQRLLTSNNSQKKAPAEEKKKKEEGSIRIVEQKLPLILLNIENIASW